MIIGNLLRKIEVSRRELKEEPARIIRRDLSLRVDRVREVANRVVIEYIFSIRYVEEGEKEYGKIWLEGELVTDDKEILEYWNKKNTLPPEKMEYIVNSFFSDCQIVALNLSRWAALPLPFNLPKFVRKKKKEESYS